MIFVESRRNNMCIRCNKENCSCAAQLAKIALLVNAVKNGDTTQAALTAAYTFNAQLIIDPQSGDIELKPGNF